MLVKTICYTAAAFLSAVSFSQASFILSFGQANSLGNGAYSVPLYIATNAPGGTEAFSGANVVIRANDGGPINDGTDTAPLISDIQFATTGSIFEGSNGSASDIESADLVAIRNYSLTSNGASVNATAMPKTLALVFIGASGLSGQSFDLSTFYKDQSTTLTVSGNPNGGATDPTTATVTVPEPSSVGFAAIAGLSLLRRRRKLLMA
jgi:hypothetical protein